MIALLIIALLWFLAGSVLVLAAGGSLRQAYVAGLLSLLIVLFWIVFIISRSERAERFWTYLDLTVRGEDKPLSWVVVWMVAIPIDLLLVAAGIWLSRWLMP